MEHIAYTENVLAKILTISGHLSEVSQRANALMLSANPNLAGSAEWAGFFYDIGRCCTQRQEYIHRTSEKSAETHQAVCGAALTFQKQCLPPQMPSPDTIDREVFSPPLKQPRSFDSLSAEVGV